MQLEKHVDVCNITKTMAQDRVCLGRRIRIYFLKNVTSKRTEHATNFSFKLFIDFLEVRGFSPKERSYREYPISTYLLSVDSQHNNYNSVTIWVCHAKILVRVLTHSALPFRSCTICQNPNYYFGIAHSNYNTII